MLGALCLLACLGLWSVNGLLNTRAGGDSPFLLMRVQQLSSNLAAGIFPARWMPDAAFGLGYPFFYFYASLPYYIAALFERAGSGLVNAIKLTQTLGMLAAGLAMHRFARTLLPPAGALLAAAAYVLAPFHLVNIYVRGDSLSEFWAFVWYPLILLYAGQSATGRRRAAFALSLSLAGLVLTHNVSALIFAPFIVVWSLLGLARATRAQRLHGLIALSAAAALALALTAWFWLPALASAATAQLSEQTTGYFNFANHFRTTQKDDGGVALIQSAFVFIADSPQSFSMGLTQTLLVLIGGFGWFIHAYRPESLRARLITVVAMIALLFGIATLMITPLAEPLWAALKPLQLAQFPWRFLSVQALFAALLTGGIASLKPWAHWAALLALLGAMLPMTLGAGVHGLAVRDEDVNPRTVQLYEWYSGNIGTTIRAEYLPATVLPRPATGPDVLGLERLALIAQEAPASALRSQLLAIEPEEQLWRITVDADALRMTLPLIYAPGWRAEVSDDRQPVALAAYPGSGWTELTLPRGTHTIRLYYTGDPLQQTSESISVIAALVAAMGFQILSMITPAPRRRRILLGLLAGALALGVIGIGTRLIQRKAFDAPDGEFVDFANRPFAHRGPILFAEMPSAAILGGATIAPDRLRAGDVFTLTLRWNKASTPLTLTMESPSGNDALDVFRHARVQTLVQTEVSTHTAPSVALPGPLLIMLTPGAALFDADAVVREDGQPVTAYLSGKAVPGVTLIGPTITGTPRNAPATALVAFQNGIRAHVVDWLRPDGERICFRAQWSRAGAVNRADALQVSFKLLGADGHLVAQADGQPQQGLAPTWSWQDDVVVHDSRCVRMIDPAHGLADGERYRLEITWYRLATGEVTGSGKLHGVARAGDGAVNAVIEAGP